MPHHSGLRGGGVGVAGGVAAGGADEGECQAGGADGRRGASRAEAHASGAGRGRYSAAHAPGGWGRVRAYVGDLNRDGDARGDVAVPDPG